MGIKADSADNLMHVKEDESQNNSSSPDDYAHNGSSISIFENDQLTLYSSLTTWINQFTIQH